MLLEEDDTMTIEENSNTYPFSQSQEFSGIHSNQSKANSNFTNLRDPKSSLRKELNDF